MPTREGTDLVGEIIGARNRALNNGHHPREVILGKRQRLLYQTWGRYAEPAPSGYDFVMGLRVVYVDLPDFLEIGLEDGGLRPAFTADGSRARLGATDP